MIKAIVFDFGGVICYPPSAQTRAELERLTGMPYDKLEVINRQYRDEWDRGTYDGQGYYRYMLPKAGLNPDDETLAKIIQTDLDGWKNLDPGTVQLMRDIKVAGCTLGILSNMPRDFLTWARDEGGIPIFTEADVGIFSCEHHIIKPEPEIYMLLQERIGCACNEIVFFDDVDNNINAACKLGMRGLLWADSKAARSQLQTMGLEL